MEPPTVSFSRRMRSMACCWSTRKTRGLILRSSSAEMRGRSAARSVSARFGLNLGALERSIYSLRCSGPGRVNASAI
jgi:hypothetical protein